MALSVTHPAPLCLPLCPPCCHVRCHAKNYCTLRRIWYPPITMAVRHARNVMSHVSGNNCTCVCTLVHACWARPSTGMKKKSHYSSPVLNSYNALTLWREHKCQKWLQGVTSVQFWPSSFFKQSLPLNGAPPNFLYTDTRLWGQTLTEITFLSLLGSHSHT